MKRRRNSESGFAMLFVFVMAAAVSIVLFKEMPRVAFERQRDIEQLLIDRGEQYKRGIQLYWRQYKKYPQTLDDLETTNNKRFLRRRYADPMTGKTEWRMIHSVNGVFTDSLVRTNPAAQDPNKKTAEPNTFTWNAPSIGSTGTEQAGQTALFNRQRPSDSANHIPGGTAPFPAAPGQQSDPNAQPVVNPNAIVDPNAPANQVGLPGPNQQSQQPQQPGGAPTQQPPGYNPGGQPQQPAQPGFPGAQVGFTPFGTPTPQPGAGATAGPQPQGGGQGAAANLIWNQLTTPRQPPPGLFNNPAQQTSSGIAGVASLAERTGIKLYKERDKYNEWEFLYDLAEDATGRNMAGQGQGLGQPGQGQNGAFPPGMGPGQRIGGQGGNGQVPFPGFGPGGQQIGPGGLPGGAGGPGQVIIQPGQRPGAPIGRAR